MFRRYGGTLKPGCVLNEGDPAGAPVRFEILGPAVTVYGASWTPVLCDGEKEPTFVRTDAIART